MNPNDFEQDWREYVLETSDSGTVLLTGFAAVAPFDTSDSPNSGHGESPIADPDLHLEDTGNGLIAE